MVKIPIDQQIAEVKREMVSRMNDYPSFIARGKITAEDGHERIIRMEAVLHTLEWCQTNRAFISRIIKADKESEGIES